MIHVTWIHSGQQEKSTGGQGQTYAFKCMFTITERDDHQTFLYDSSVPIIPDHN